MVVSESVTRRSGIDEEFGTTSIGGWDDVLGGKYGLHLSVKEVALWIRLLVWGIPEVVLREAWNIGVVIVEASAGHSGSATSRRPGSASGGRSPAGV